MQSDKEAERGRFHATAGSLDLLLRATYEAIDRDGEYVQSTRGDSRELRGASLELTEPRARLSRSRLRGRAISALGEFAWYLTGSADLAQIEHYIPSYGHKINAEVESSGAYGPRLFGPAGQFDRILELLRAKPSTRQAVIQIFDRADLDANPSDVPCTCTLQFFVRNGTVELQVHMRSNDAYIGLPHDIFVFTMLQEMAARTLGVELGTYLHTVGSLHIYDKHRPGVLAYLNEGLFEPRVMPPMPADDLLGHRAELVLAEAELRAGATSPLALPAGYWGDLARVLAAQQIVNDGPASVVEQLGADLRSTLSDDYFGIYISDQQFRTAREDLGETSV